MKKRLAIILSMVILSTCLTACGGGGTSASNSAGTSGDGSGSGAPTETYEAILGHHCADSTLWQYGAEKFAQLVDEYTNGGVKITIYSNSELGDEKQLTEMTTEGTIQFSLPGSMVSTQWITGTDVFSLPFMYETEEEAQMVLDSELGKEITANFNDIDIQILGAFESGFRQLFTTTKAINSLEDLQGLKVRVPESELYISTWQALGAAPLAMSWSEVYSSLQTHVIDGAEPPIGTGYDSMFGEVCENFAYINYLYDPIFIAVNQTWFNSLPAEYQEAIQKAATDAVADERIEANTRNTETEAKLVSEYGVNITHPDLSAFQEAVQPVYDNYADQETLQAVLALLGRA